MNTAETISVNPVSKTLGALNPEATLRFLQENARKVDVSHNKKSLSLSRLFFSTSTPGVSIFSGRMLAFRLMFAALLIVSGSFILAGEITSPINFIDPYALALTEIIAGGMLALGFMTRPAMAATTLLFGCAATLNLMEGIFDMQAMLCCLGSMIFMVMGAGRFSTDFLIRKAIVMRKHRKQKQMREDRLSYKAYRIYNMQ